VILNTALALALLHWQFSKHGPDLVSVMPLFVAYFTCCLQFMFSKQRRTGGFVVTLLGLLAWSLVFPLGLVFDTFYPNVQVGAEVWNLPKYLVAVGMILLLLEGQLKRNQHLAQHDALTGLPNRRLFQDRISGAIERARQRHARMAMLAIDLDGFKQVNDTLGHHVGDAVLQQVARLFTARLRRIDTLARTGGDEFSVVLEGPITRKEAAEVASALQQLLDTPLSIEGHTMQIGASIGLAMFPDDALTPHGLCIRADERMYIVKRNGGCAVQAG
jgi:diguanylate cyclase (GGDEF)-like protein